LKGISSASVKAAEAEEVDVMNLAATAILKDRMDLLETEMPRAKTDPEINLSLPGGKLFVILLCSSKANHWTNHGMCQN